MSWQYLEHQASNSVEQPDPHSETSQHIISGSQTTSKIFWYLCKARISPISWIPTGFFMVFPMVPSNATVYDHIPKQHCLLVYQYIIYLTISPHLTISYDITIKKSISITSEMSIFPHQKVTLKSPWNPRRTSAEAAPQAMDPLIWQSPGPLLGSMAMWLWYGHQRWGESKHYIYIYYIYYYILYFF